GEAADRKGAGAKRIEGGKGQQHAEMQAEMREEVEGRVERAEKAEDDGHIECCAQTGRPRCVPRGTVFGAAAGHAGAQAAAYWKAVSEKLLSLRECSRSSGIAASFSMARMPMVRCCETCRL